MFQRCEYHMSYQEKKLLEGRIAVIFVPPRGASCGTNKIGPPRSARHIPGHVANQIPCPQSGTYPATRMADGASRVKYSCSQVAETVNDERQLDFYFLYKIDAEVDDAKVVLNRLKAAYIYDLASKLLPCAGGEDVDKEAKSNDYLFTVVAIDSAKQDEVLEIGETYIHANDIQFTTMSCEIQIIHFSLCPQRNLFFIDR